MVRMPVPMGPLMTLDPLMPVPSGYQFVPSKRQIRFTLVCPAQLSEAPPAYKLVPSPAKARAVA